MSRANQLVGEPSGQASSAPPFRMPIARAVFCDVFTFVGDKIQRLETYQVNLS